MATGKWEDFTSKWGFNDGESTCSSDWKVRDRLCKDLNELECVKTSGIRVVPFDRNGMHNGCMILLIKDVEGKSPEDLLEMAQMDNSMFVDNFPSEVWEGIAELWDDMGDIEGYINELYYQIDPQLRLGNVDWDALRDQKLELLNVMAGYDKERAKLVDGAQEKETLTKRVDAFEGILGLLDAVQDSAAESLGELVVFGKLNDN